MAGEVTINRKGWKKKGRIKKITVRMFVKIMKNCYFYLPTIIYNAYNYLDIDI